MNKVLPRLILVLAVILLTVAADQVTKKVAQAQLKGRGVVFVVGDIFVMRYIENEGAFLGMGAALSPPVKTAVFIAFPLAMLIGLLVFIFRSRTAGTALTLGLALITAGGTGNLIDRILYHGRVSDFMNLGIGSLRTGIFNVADLAIVAGFVLIVLFELGGPKKKDELPAGEKSEKPANNVENK